MDTILTSFLTSLIVSLVTFVLGLKAGKNQSDRKYLQDLYKKLHVHFRDLKDGLISNRYKRWQDYKEILKGNTIQYYPVAKEFEYSGDSIYVHKKIMNVAKDLERDCLVFESKSSHLIEDVHSYIISQSLELFLDELTDSTYQKKDKSNIETVNPTGCNSYMTYSYYLLLDKDAFIKELNYVTGKNNCAMKLVTRGNPPTRSLTIYPKSLAVTSADFIEQLTNFIVSKDPKYQEEKSKLIKRIDKLDRKLIKNAKNPTGFWETVVGAFVDLFS